MFFDNMAIAAQQVGILYVIVAVGFLCDRLKIFTQTTAKLSNNLLFYVVTPTVIVHSFLSTEFSGEKAASLGIAFLGAVGTMTLGMFLGAPFFKKKGNDRSVYQFSLVYGNMGYMALPLAQAVLGSEGVFYCSAGVMAFNTVCFTHGVWLMSKREGQKGHFELKNILLNPGVISVLIGLPLFVTGVRLPELVTKPLEFIQVMNTPLAMIFFGTYIANTELKKMFIDKNIYLVSFLKLFIIPLTMFSIYNKLFGMSGTLLRACMISASVPSANNTVMFAAKYGHDTGTASKIVTLVSFLSIFTLPLMIAISSS